MNRIRLADTRESITHTVIIYAEDREYEFTFTVGFYPDGRPGEVFIELEKDSSKLAGTYGCFGVAISMLLQSTWTLADLARKFAHQRFAPEGMTNNKEIPFAKSPVDYLFRWLTEHMKGKSNDIIG